MHRARVVRQKQLALPKLLDQLLESRATDEIDAAIAQRRGDLSAHLLVLGRAEKNPLSANCGSRGGETFGQPAFRRSVFRAGTEPQPQSAGLAEGRGGIAISSTRPFRLTIARCRDNAPPGAAAAPSARASERSGSKASAGDARHNQPGAARRPARARAPRGKSSERRRRHQIPARSESNRPHAKGIFA